MDCTVCGAPLKGMDRPAKHVKACEMIDMALLAEQLTPTVAELPGQFKVIPWLEDPGYQRGSP